MANSVRTQVEALRQKLLDLSLRNRMLNFRPSKRLGLIITGEDACQLHRLLVEDGRKMTFAGKPDPPKSDRTEPRLSSFDDPVAAAQYRQEAEEELSAYLEAPYATVSQTDTKLNTDEYESALQAKLRTIQREATLANEELGIATLFLTLGMLEWHEPDSSRLLRAPLLFVPVNLERQANGTLRLVHAGGDVGDNLPLRAKLLELNLKLPVYSDEQPLAIYFEAVYSTIRSRGDWSVLPDEVALGFFNYEKYAMYVDLGGEAWSEDRKPWHHPDVTAMLGGGYETPDSPIGDHTQLDSVRPVAECHEVYDADSSQTLAMIRAAEGLSIVVEGPPGTGKSQTITNIIAEAVEAGKKVLFVSAKRAALEVVKRRLEEADLGAVCLDLHDKLTNRREFYSELKRTAERSLSLRSEEERVARLTELRDRLNEHAEAVNQPLEQFGCTPFAAMARLAALPAETPEDREGRVDFARLRNWTESEARKRLPLVAALQARIREIGVPVEHPFWGVGLEHLDPGLRLDLEVELRQATEAWNAAEAAVQEAAEAFRIDPPARVADVRVLRACAERAQSVPPLDGVALRLNTWKTEASRVRTILGHLRSRQHKVARHTGKVTDEAWDQDWLPTLAAYEAHAHQWHRFLFGDFRRAKNSLTKVLTPAGPQDPLAQRELLGDLVLARADLQAITEGSEWMSRLFGVQWRSESSDPELLERLLEWVLRLHADVESSFLPPGLLEFFAGQAPDSDLLQRTEQAERLMQAAVTRYGVVSHHLRMPGDLYAEEIATVGTRLRRWSESLPLLPGYLGYAASQRQALVQGLDAVVEVGSRWPLAGERLETAFLRSYYSGVIREAIAERPALRDFDRAAHERAISEYQSLDDFKLSYNRARVRLAHQRRLPSFAAAAGNLLLLRQQCELQRRHKPIRWILERAGEAVTHIKPVFMMSPLSTAIHLPPEMPPFDLVIFDEASQVRPEDALSAIIRGRQTIVVGDTRQMPPTSFFDRVADDDEPEAEELDEAAELGQEARKLESILSMMSAVTMGRVRRPDLRWHYRSLHPALIQPSNELFYDGRLVVFPSASLAPGGRRIGVVFHHLPEAIYEGGARARVNRVEAEHVVEAVVAHLRERPEESLMVAAMNKPQADLIYDLLQIRERQEPEPFREFRARHLHEPLDVKNLENVQGDERDVVFVSVTYGRDASGVIRQQFGPLLRDGGERRLNVLITRARRRCEVFSNLTADDVRMEGNRPGLAAFKSYLRFAQTGQLQGPTLTETEPESPFEVEVITALRGRGYEVDAQVGSEGYRIDLAVVDPKAPGRYLLGVECDGATYHSARSARDRDKLRQRVLEARGWRLHRIWSSDWWQDREGEIARLIQALEETREDEAEPAPEPPDEVPTPEITERTGEPQPATVRPYGAAPSYTGDSLPDYAAEVVTIEGPVQHDLLLTRLRVAAGYARMGNQVRADLEALLAELAQEGRIRRAGDGWISGDEQLVAPRDWSERPAAERKVSYISEVELAAAYRQVIGNAYGIRAAEATREALALLGFRSVGDKGIQRATAVLEALLANGEVVEREGCLWLSRE